MATTRYIEWTVTPSDLDNSPLGYEVELSESVSAFSPTATHSTFARARDFAVDIDGSGNFEPYPYQGLTEATSSTVVRLLLNEENPNSCLIVGNGRSLIKMSLDCKKIIAEKLVCGAGYFIDSISSATKGGILVKDTSGTITVFDRSLRPINQFSIGADCIFVAADPFRNVIWRVTQSSVSLVRTKDLSTSFTAGLPIDTEKILDWDISRQSGRLFMVLDGSPTATVSVSMDGTVTPFSSGASSVCQWGATGALACVPGLSQVDILDSSMVTDNFQASSIGLRAPSKIASRGTSCAFVVDVDGKMAKIDANWAPQWTLQSPWEVTDIFASDSNGLGSVVYLASLNGIAAYRDMINEGWMYGKIEMLNSMASHLPCPVATAVTGIHSSHIWAKPIATEPSGEPFLESSSWNSSSSSL
jgi:hypothetical protein